MGRANPVILTKPVYTCPIRSRPEIAAEIAERVRLKAEFLLFLQSLFPISLMNLG